MDCRSTTCGGPARSRRLAGKGRGCAGWHHGEILQGLYRSAPGGPAVPCLVTLPVPDAGSVAHFTPECGQPITVRPECKLKAARAARLTLDALGDHSTGGALELECPVPEGLGLGSSTSDVVATIRAVCAARGAQLDPARLASLAVAAELACDPIMLDGVALFAQREGRVLEHWGQWMPQYLLLSVDTDPGRGGVDTLSIPLPHGHELAAEYDMLIARARAAFRLREAIAIGQVATRSAELNQQMLPMREFEALRAMSAADGCLGLQISHSGTVAGLLFDRATRSQALEPLVARVRALGMAPLGIFATGPQAFVCTVRQSRVSVELTM
ncbi:MAG: hypothetical protein ACRET0_07825 [Steroidobacteraceae bacterium]